LWARGPCPTWVPGPSTSPLDRTVRVTATFASVATLLASQLLAGDAPSEPSTDAPTCGATRLSEASAIRIALAHLKRRKMDISHLDTPTASCSITDKGKTWSVYFQDKPVVLDGCFWVRVDDRTGKVDPVYVICG
jgi:hypothetical protein